MVILPIVFIDVAGRLLITIYEVGVNSGRRL
jgi:hypothetical protein